MLQNSNLFVFWRKLGLPVRAANILCNLGCQSVDEVRAIGRDNMKAEFGLGPPNFNAIAALVDWPPWHLPAASRTTRRVGSLQQTRDGHES